MYQTLYTQNGEMFEVPIHKATALLLSGWTLTYPEDLTKVFSNPSYVNLRSGDSDTVSVPSTEEKESD